MNLRDKVSKKEQLLFKLHNEVVKSAISGWMKEVLKQSGMTMEYFKAPSTRSTPS